MSLVDFPGTRPQLSKEQQQMVLGTLRFLLDSPQFSKSSRYPALLEFAVRAALGADSNAPKERTVGVQVFGRPADYDTSTDSVVRVAAGEVRRRMAAYFSDHPEAPVRFELPAGSYKVEFHFRPQPVKGDLLQEPLSQSSNSEHPRIKAGGLQIERVDALAKGPESKVAPRRWITRTPLMLFGSLVLIVFLAGLWRRQFERARQDFWWPLLHNDQPALILVGKTNQPTLEGAADDQQLPSTVAPGTPSNLVLNDAIVVAQICSIFREYQRECKIAPAGLASVEELHSNSVVLVGGFNNPWTVRLLTPLPYQIKFDTTTEPIQKRTRLIVEHKATGDIPLGGKFGADYPSTDFSHDYAIIARFRSDITDGMAIVVAGLGIPGTSGAGQFVTSPDKWNELRSRAPKDWKGTNFEAVLQIDVVQGSPNHVEVIASRFW